MNTLDSIYRHHHVSSVFPCSPKALVLLCMVVKDADQRPTHYTSSEPYGKAVVAMGRISKELVDAGLMTIGGLEGNAQARTYRATELGYRWFIEIQKYISGETDCFPPENLSGL